MEPQKDFATNLDRDLHFGPDGKPLGDLAFKADLEARKLKEAAVLSSSQADTQNPGDAEVRAAIVASRVKTQGQNAEVVHPALAEAWGTDVDSKSFLKTIDEAKPLDSQNQGASARKLLEDVLNASSEQKQ